MNASRGKWFAAFTALVLVVSACTSSPTDGNTGTTTVSSPSTTRTAATNGALTSTTIASTTTRLTDSTELILWADETRAAVLEKAVKAFEDATGVTITIEIIEFSQIRGQVQIAGPNGEGPDIFIGANGWTGQLVTDGVVQPIDFRDNDGDFLQVALDGFRFAGSLYAMPYATETVAMYYNADLVAQAPATFEEIADICAALSDIDNCVGVPGGGDVSDAFHNYPFMSALGGYVFAYDATTGYDLSDIGLNSRNAVSGLDFLVDQIDAGVIGSVDYDEAQNLFLNGEQPFWVTGPWELGTLGDSALNWSVAKLPTINGQPQSPFVGAQGFFVSAFSEYAVIAQSFLFDYVATAETMQALHDADPRIPAFRSVLDALSDDPVTRAFALSAADGQPIPNLPEMESVWGPLGENLRAIRNGELSPQEAMDAASQAVEESLDG